MKYSPALPEKNDNVSHNKPLAECALLLSGAALIFATAYALLGFFVDLAADSISFETESALFSSRAIQYDLTDGTQEDKRKELQQLVNELRGCTDIPYPVSVHIIKSEEPNAVAMPGGHILVFEGLLKALPRRSGLAFVMAHELGHFSSRDHLRALGRSLVLYSLSALLTGGDSAISGMLAPQAALSSAQYSQTRESAADRFAVDTLACRAGTIEGATDFFEYLSAKSLEAEIRLFHYFSSHPQARERLDAIIKYADSKGYAR